MFGCFSAPRKKRVLGIAEPKSTHPCSQKASGRDKSISARIKSPLKGVIGGIKGDYSGDYIGDRYRVMKGDTRSLNYA